MRVRRLIAFFVPLFFTSSALGEKTTKQHLSEADIFLSSGQYEDALRSYGAAINQDPKNYLSYFKRAATLLSLGKHSSALEDFSKVLELKPDFDNALLQRAKLYVKEGYYDDAKQDLNEYLRKKPDDNEAKELLASTKEAENLITSVETLLNDKQYDECVKSLATAIQISPHNVHLRLTKASCHFEKSEVEEGVRDLTQASKLDPSNSETLIRLSLLNLFAFYQPEESKAFMKQCLHYDPEHKECKKIHRRIKEIHKAVDRVEKDIEKHRWQLAIDKLMKSGTDNGPGLIDQVAEEHKKLKEGHSSRGTTIKLYGLACKAYKELKDGSKAMKWCSAVLKYDKDNADALINRAEAYILMADYEAAVRDYEKAREVVGDDDPRIKQGYPKAKQHLKQSKTKDYYKTLGVARTATKKEIKKAYRKLAQEWHPDKYRGDLAPEDVERKMSQINEAYEVLNDDELRERYDNGDDPNDPTGGSPFTNADNPFMHFRNGGFSFNGFPFGAGPSGDGNFKWTFKF